ncbi:MAG: glycoside hydrolase family 13 protein [Clostridia bacterium]|nr:glycoside hydrolase family 13 protein [Clostridia bacterium]
MRILYDSKQNYYKSPFGCLREDEKCTLRIDIPTSCKTTLVRLIIKDEAAFEMVVPFVKEKSENNYDTFKTEFSLFAKNLYFYYFNIRTQEGAFDLYKQGNDTNIGEGDLWQLTCFDKNYDTPEEFKGRVMYQIFPDRFFQAGNTNLQDKLEPYVVHEDVTDIPVFTPDAHGEILNNDFYGGNLKGICKKLPYLKELGVGILYLNPIFYAYSNHRYDTADYKRIDPMLGTEKDFVELCKAAHTLDMKIILDGVFSHTGSNSVYFDEKHLFGNGACSNDASPYRSWFMFDEYPNRYTSWWGIKTLPCVDELNPSYMDYIIYAEDSVVAHWLSLGADGFRLDVADELPDRFIKALKVRMKELNPASFLIGEVWEDASNKISYGARRTYFSQNELDSVMNYPFRDAILNFVKGNISGTTFSQIVMTIAENYPRPVLDCVMNLLSTHDTPRLLTVLSGKGEGMSKADKAGFHLQGDTLLKAMSLAKLAAVLQFTLPGNPCIYYGDEIGMQGFEDPLNRAYFSWQDADCALHAFYQKLSALKNQNQALQKGDIRICEAYDKAIKFSRTYGDETVFVEISLDGELEPNDNTIFAFCENHVGAVVFRA